MWKSKKFQYMKPPSIDKSTRIGNNYQADIPPLTTDEEKKKADMMMVINRNKKQKEEIDSSKTPTTTSTNNNNNSENHDEVQKVNEKRTLERQGIDRDIIIREDDLDKIPAEIGRKKVKK